MSRILDLGKDNCRLPDLLAEYEDALIGVEDKIKLEGKNLEQANRENPAWLHYYDHKRIELATLVDFLNTQVKQSRGKLYKSYTENHTIDIAERGKEQYINTEPAYLTKHEVFLEVKEVYEKYVSVVDAIRARGYALNNITRIRVASLEDTEIY